MVVDSFLPRLLPSRCSRRVLLEYHTTVPSIPGGPSTALDSFTPKLLDMVVDRPPPSLGPAQPEPVVYTSFSPERLDPPTPRASSSPRIRLWRSWSRGFVSLLLSRPPGSDATLLPPCLLQVINYSTSFDGIRSVLIFDTLRLMATPDRTAPRGVADSLYTLASPPPIFEVVSLKIMPGVSFKVWAPIITLLNPERLVLHADLTFHGLFRTKVVLLAFELELDKAGVLGGTGLVCLRFWAGLQ